VWDPEKSQEGASTTTEVSDFNVWLATSYDGWVSQKMSFCEDTSDYRLICMVPPGANQYVFVVKDLSKRQEAVEPPVAGPPILPTTPKAAAPDPTRLIWENKVKLKKLESELCALLDGGDDGPRRSLSGVQLAGKLDLETKIDDCKAVLILLEAPPEEPAPTPVNAAKLKMKLQEEEQLLIKSTKTEVKQMEAELKALMENKQVGELNDADLVQKLSLEKKIEEGRALLKKLNPPAPDIVPTAAIDKPCCNRLPTFGTMSDKSVKNLPFKVNLVVIEREKKFDENGGVPRSMDAVAVKVGKWR